MVSPFEKKNILLARVGIKDDTSRSKFRDTLLSDFFGKKGGISSKKKFGTETIVDVSTENLLKLPANYQDELSRDRQTFQYSTESSVGETCSTTKGDAGGNRIDNSVYVFAGFVLATLVLSKKLEKLYLQA